MRAWPTISIIALWGVLNTLCPAIADELHLSNGDVITGRLIRMAENKIFFKTQLCWRDQSQLARGHKPDHR